MNTTLFKLCSLAVFFYGTIANATVETGSNYEVSETDLIFPANITYDPSVKLPITWVIPTADVAMLMNPSLGFSISRISNEPTSIPNKTSTDKYDFNMPQTVALTNTTSIREGNKIYVFAFVEGMTHEGQYLVAWRPFMEDCEHSSPKYANAAAQEYSLMTMFTVKAGGSVGNLVEASRNCSMATVQYNVSRQAPSNRCVNYSKDYPNVYNASTSCSDGMSNVTAANITRLAQCYWNSTAPGCVAHASLSTVSTVSWTSFVLLSSFVTLFVI